MSLIYTQGLLTQLRGHSRGILPMISGGGFIHAWTHLYRSESPSQAAIFLLSFFITLFKDIPKKDWPDTKFFLSYDNMCNLGNQLFIRFIRLQFFTHTNTNMSVKIRHLVIRRKHHFSKKLRPKLFFIFITEIEISKKK